MQNRLLFNYLFTSLDLETQFYKITYFHGLGSYTTYPMHCINNEQ